MCKLFIYVLCLWYQATLASESSWETEMDKFKAEAKIAHDKSQLEISRYKEEINNLQKQVTYDVSKVQPYLSLNCILFRLM